MGRILGDRCGLLLVTLPLAVWCLGEGGLTFGRMLGVYAVMALLIGVICAVSLGLSALVPRTSTSGVLSHLLVFFLTVGTGVLFALLLQVTGEEVSGPGGFTTTEQRPERVWWMLAPNPFVVLADAAPATPTARVELIDGEVVETRAPSDLLGAMRAELRIYRLTAAERELGTGELGLGLAGLDGPPLWPTGLGIQLILAAGALILTERRLRTPSGNLPVGQRVA
ncbi:MAG: hypothetical protein M3513_13890 [Actinomycetota bacterium]|nr:hypothetical protein [Actinomycetota bacterium]